MASVFTRVKLKCLIFRDAKELGNTVPPTYEYFMRCYLYVKHPLQLETTKEPSASSIAGIVAFNTE